MPPANMQWTDPLVQADECITHSRIGESNSRPDVVRRITPKSKHDTLPKQCEAGCDLSPQGSPTRYWQMGQRKRRKRKSARMLTSSRTINATLWMIIVVGLLYCRRGLDRPASSSWPAEHEQQKDMDALPAISTAMYLDQRFTRKLRAETIVQQDSQQIIHIIHTRFMQNQPDLLDLGLARLELFKEFTLQSLHLQSSRNFLWVIRTDPHLDAALRQSLLESLSIVDNHLLIASNENPNVQSHDITSVDPTIVWSGDLERAKRYLRQETNAQTNIILESRLDADDALHVDFVQHVQGVALAELPKEAAQWKIWCASHHIEWQYHSATDTIDTTSGVLLSMKDSVCVSAGLTIGYTEGVRVHDLPPIKHQQLAKTLRSCKKHKSKCLAFINLFPTALRARTPTSAGMLNVLLGKRVKVDGRYVKGAKKQETVQSQLWSVATPRFGFSPEQGSRLRAYLKEHLRSIAADNLRGQCSAGHSCKESSKVLLQAIVDHPEAFG